MRITRDGEPIRIVSDEGVEPFIYVGYVDGELTCWDKAGNNQDTAGWNMHEGLDLDRPIYSGQQMVGSVVANGEHIWGVVCDAICHWDFDGKHGVSLVSRGNVPDLTQEKERVINPENLTYTCNGQSVHLYKVKKGWVAITDDDYVYQWNEQGREGRNMLTGQPVKDLEIYV